MKPLKFIESFAYWLLRIAYVAYIVVSNIGSFRHFDISDFQLYLAMALIVLGVLIIIGGLTSNQGLTVIASAGIFIIMIYKALTPWPSMVTENFFIELVLAFVALVFASRGN